MASESEMSVLPKEKEEKKRSKKSEIDESTEETKPKEKKRKENKVSTPYVLHRFSKITNSHSSSRQI